MKNLIMIKSFPNGITLFLDEKAEFKDILKEIETKFIESEKFFKNSRVALAFEGRKVSVLEQQIIVNKIMEVCSINIGCVIEQNNEIDKMFQKALRTEKVTATSKDILIEKNIQDGESLESEQTVVIKGNIEKGGLVISSKNIIVLGSLEGSALAGQEMEPGDSSFIYANYLNPEVLQIGKSKLKKIKQEVQFLKNRIQPKIVTLHKNRLIVESVKKETF